MALRKESRDLWSILTMLPHSEELSSPKCLIVARLRNPGLISNFFLLGVGRGEGEGDLCVVKGARGIVLYPISAAFWLRKSNL